MPRPGPRPYECVRRAWHSERHQPIRGSIIQQIFKVLHESHSPSTKKNKEWQEKLPIVVLKAEEIMYSKANSEAEYMDFQTLWERVNDAVNTIIRRDESTESGDLLPPCVEAALNLGCVPVRASRSQRHTNPRSYLSPRPDESPCSSSKITENPTKNQNHQLLPRSVDQSDQPIGYRPFCAKNPFRYTSNTQSFSINGSSVYPLYYGTQFPKKPENSRFPCQLPRNSNPIIVGTPVFPSETGSSRLGCFEIPVLGKNHGKYQEAAPEPEFDLSLRLGSFKDPCAGQGKGPVNKTNKEFSFFPVDTTKDPSGYGTRRWSFEGEGQTAGTTVKKRKMSFDINTEDELISQQFGSDHFTGQIKRPGL